jgi:cyclopropane-fatty-acyl-phospholipid synthase
MEGMLNRILDSFFRRAIKKGNLTVTWFNGQTSTYGDRSGEPVALKFLHRKTEWAVALRPDPGLAEAFMDGNIELNSPTIYPFIHLVLSNTNDYEMSTVAQVISKILYWTRSLRQHNTVRRARKNVAHHYDLEAGLYSLFLDNDRQYSCAYFLDDNQDLDGAQLTKKRHLAAKLHSQPDQSLLDIGSAA